MTPKEKATDIFVKMLETIPDDIIQDVNTARGIAKIHSQICVDEIIKNELPVISRIFWHNVKQEIEKL